MKSVKIIRLTLENFKCHRLLNLQFDGLNAGIYGDNAAGKTSVYDALTWLLFGKDSAGNGEKNIEIKPLDSLGNVADHSAVTAVEVELSVDGETVILKRTYKEVWSTKRGSSIETFTGNTSEYYIDGVPYKKNAFDDKVREIVSEDVFRLLTSVSYFAAGLPWQQRRAVLFDMAGTLTDREIMAGNEAFAPLLEAMGKLELEDYKKKLGAEKRNLTGAKTEIPARISECQKTVEDLEGLDFAAAQAELDALNARKESLSEQVLAIENDTALSQKRLQIREAQMDLSALEKENEAYRRSQQNMVVDTVSIARELDNLRTRLSGRRKLLENEEQFIAHMEEKLQASRNEWAAVSTKTFSGGTCASCGQTLPADKLQRAMEAFEANRKDRLRRIEATAASLKDTKAQAEYRIASYREEISGLEGEILGKEQQLTAANANVVEIVDMEDFGQRRQALMDRIQALGVELAGMADNTIAVKGQLQQQIVQVRQQAARAAEIVNKRSVLDYAHKRIETLRQDAKNAAECLEAVEKMLYLIDEYTRYKTRFVEDSVNSLFRLAKFRLFREQANGGVEDRCDVVYDGVPYLGLNNGMKINVGIDIINALSRHHGVCVPLFVDNAESVTRLEYAGTQVIRLVVSAEDKKLRCVNENP